MNTMQRETKARRTMLWGTLGAVAFMMGSSGSAQADSFTPYLRSAPTFLTTGKVLNCNIANVSAKPLQILAGILQSRNDDSTRKTIPNGGMGHENFVAFSNYQVVDLFTGFLTISSYATGTPTGMYSCFFAVSSTDGSAVTLSDVRAQGEVYAGPTGTTVIVPVQ